MKKPGAEVIDEISDAQLARAIAILERREAAKIEKDREAAGLRARHVILRYVGAGPTGYPIGACTARDSQRPERLRCDGLHLALSTEEKIHPGEFIEQPAGHIAKLGDADYVQVEDPEKRLVTLEDFERVRVAEMPALEAAARAGECARRLDELGKQAEVIERARAEEAQALAAREEDLRRAQAAFAEFLDAHPPEWREAALAGRPPWRPSPQSEAEMSDRERLAEEYRSGRIDQRALVRLTAELARGASLADAKKTVAKKFSSSLIWDPRRGVTVPDV